MSGLQKSGNKLTNQPKFKQAEKYVFALLKKKLPDTLYYHGMRHTTNMIKAAMQIAAAENISEEKMNLLRTAVVFHDAGFIYVYKKHEEKSCKMARKILPAFDFSEKQIESICGMIMATKVPQQPKNILEKIIADADLEYLGTDQAPKIAKRLFKELKHRKPSFTKKDWNQMQIAFIQKHKYFTKFCKKNRNPAKLKYLNNLINGKG